MEFCTANQPCQKHTVTGHCEPMATLIELFVVCYRAAVSAATSHPGEAAKVVRSVEDYAAVVRRGSWELRHILERHEAITQKR